MESPALNGCGRLCSLNAIKVKTGGSHLASHISAVFLDTVELPSSYICKKNLLLVNIMAVMPSYNKNFSDFYLPI